MAHHKEFAVKLDKISPISDFMTDSLPTVILHIILKNAKKKHSILIISDTGSTCYKKNTYYNYNTTF